MFKNCCGCGSKKTKRMESEEDEDEEEKNDKERDNQINKVIEEENETSEREIAQKDEIDEKPVPSKTSLKKPKPRLSISTEVKIIPTNFPEGMPDFPDEGEVNEAVVEEKDDENEEEEEEVEEEEEEEEEEELDGVQKSVKNIDGKIIKKSVTDESVQGPPPVEAEPEDTESDENELEDRPISPLSDEVFSATEKSPLLRPMNNLGVKLASTQMTDAMLLVPAEFRTQPSWDQISATKSFSTESSTKPSSIQPFWIQPFLTQSPLNDMPDMPDTPDKPDTPDMPDMPDTPDMPDMPDKPDMPIALQKWLSEDDEELGGALEPPATPVARDELALKRHRFFSELLSVAQAATEHRVRFDPFGPTIEALSDVDQGPLQVQAKEFEALLSRLENITTRLEKAVPALEKTIEPIQNCVVVTKSLEDLLDEHLTSAEKKNLNILIGREEESESRKEDASAISPDSSADIEDLSDKDITLKNNFDKLLNGHSDRSENSSISQSTVVRGTYEREEEDINEVKSVENCCTPDLDSCEEKEQEPEELVPENIEMTNNQSTLSMSVQGFQDIIQGPFATYLQISEKIGGDVAAHSKLVAEAFKSQLQYLSMASQSARPSDDANNQLLKPTSDHITAIQSFREKNRGSTYFNHLSAVSESIPALGWVTISPTPAPYIKEMNDAGQFYTNRVLKDWKEKDKIHADWTKSWIQTLSELQAYVKQYHTTGLVWSGTSSPRVGGIPPPPPVGMPPPPPVLDFAEFNTGDNKQDRSALFAEINQGENITKGLKKVTADMQTHKNPAIRTGPAPFKTPSFVTNQSPMPYKAPSPPEKPPKFAREGKKWIIEYQKDKTDLLVTEAEMNNVIYIFKCTNSTINVKGKVNSIFVDSCKKTAVVFENVVSSIEFVNCQSVQMQVFGKVPTISIDKTDGCQMYLSKDSLDTEIISSKSSEMNVLVPTGSEDFAEFPVPEQFKTTVGKKGLSTIAVENKG